jgi:hemerythrin-like domain-containing protein
MQADRRIFVQTALGAALALAGNRPAGAAEEEVSPGEDLMREHGALRRIMLVYDEAETRIGGRTALPLDALHAAAATVRRFVEEYHEKLEEQHVFPRFKSGPLHDLVTVLLTQHRRGRQLTDAVLELTASKASGDDASRQRLASTLAAFNHMYRAHAAREDTVLFPALHRSMSEKAWDALGDRFEDIEHRVLGKAGFEGVLATVDQIEKAFGIHDLSRYTPPPL